MRLGPFFAGIAPLLAFLFIGTELYDIFVGAVASVVVALIVLIAIYLREKNIAKFAIFSVGLSAILTIGALIAEESLFIKIQPTLFNLSFAGVLLIGRAFSEANDEAIFRHTILLNR